MIQRNGRIVRKFSEYGLTHLKVGGTFKKSSLYGLFPAIILFTCLIEVVHFTVLMKLFPSTPIKNPVTDQDQPIRLNQDYMNYLKTLGPIPRIVHVFFPDKSIILHREFNMVKNGIGSLIDMNPEWKVIVYNDTDIDTLIAESSDLLPPDEIELLHDAHVVEKTDIARLIVMYKYGGIYTDLDRWVNIPLDSIFRNTSLTADESNLLPAMCLPSFEDINFMQSLLCSAPGNFIWKKNIEIASCKRMGTCTEGKVMERRGGWLKQQDLFKLGPPLYNLMVFRYVFEGPLAQVEARKQDGPDPSKNVMKMARQAIQRDSNGLIVTAHDHACNSLLSRYKLESEGGDGCPRHDKRKLQAFFHIRQWGHEVRERWNETFQQEQQLLLQQQEEEKKN